MIFQKPEASFLGRESFVPVVVYSFLCHIVLIAGMMLVTRAIYRSHDYERPPTFELVKLQQIFEIPPEPKQAAAPKLHMASAKPVPVRPAVAEPQPLPVEEKNPVPSEQKTEPPAQPPSAASQPAPGGPPGPPTSAPVSTDNVYEAGMVDEPPVVSKKVEPFYPEFVKDQGISGIVRAQVTIDEKGTVMEIKILSSPHELLTDEVMKAVRRWQYKPGKFKGVAVKVRNRPIEIEFRLD
ncbi:MAG TPA: TonB family protein [Chitinivibrionales bacterium]|nr:TonB family protein [Chitinivibrionales bacterium]